MICVPDTCSCSSVIAPSYTVSRTYYHFRTIHLSITTLFDLVYSNVKFPTNFCRYKHKFLHESLRLKYKNIVIYKNIYIYMKN